MPNEALARGITSFSFNNVAFPSNGTGGTALAVPRNRGGEGIAMSWFTAYTGGPSAVSIALQVSDDGTTWYQLDTSTVTGGEMKTVTGVCWRLIRGFLTSRTGGTNITIGVTI